MDGTDARIIAASPMIGRTSGPVREPSTQIPDDARASQSPIPVVADLDVGSGCSLARCGWGW